MTRLLSGVLVLAAVLPAGAEEPAERADRLFEEGRRLLDAGKLAEACRAFEESEALDAATGTLLNLGDCYARQGRTATALRMYRQAVARAATEGDEPRRSLAESRAAEAAGRVPRLVIHPRGGAALVILRDGEPMPLAQLGVEVPVDPGPHTIAVTAPGQKPWSTRIDVQAASRVIVDLPYGLDPRPAERDWRATAGIALAATGAASLVASGLFGVAARERWQVAERHCRDGLCDAEGLDAAAGARRTATTSTAFLVAAGVLGVGGAYLWWRYDEAPAAPAATVTPIGAGGGAALSLRGRF